MQLSSTETRALEEGRIVPIAVNQTEGVILRTDVFDRVEQLIYDDSDLSPDNMQSLLATIGREAGWDDPAMDAYDNYDEERAQQCRCVV